MRYLRIAVVFVGAAVCVAPDLAAAQTYQPQQHPVTPAPPPSTTVVVPAHPVPPPSTTVVVPANPAPVYAPAAPVGQSRRVSRRTSRRVSRRR